MDLIEIGEIVNTHGIRGEMKLNPWTDDLDALTEQTTFYYKNGEEVRKLVAERVRIHKNCAIIKVCGIDDMQTAEGFRGKWLFVEKEELPEGRFYIADLIGLPVFTEEGTLGILTDVFNTGANDIYEVKTEEGKKVLLPAIKQVINEINVEKGFIKVTLIEGLLD